MENIRGVKKKKEKISEWQIERTESTGQGADTDGKSVSSEANNVNYIMSTPMSQWMRYCSMQHIASEVNK